MFESINTAAADPILGLNEIYNQDTRPNKINLGIGVYKDETGKTPVLDCVKKAELYLLENQTSKNYLPIEGLNNFAQYSQQLLFGQDSAIVTEQRARTAQTPGGTGALRIAADFVANHLKVKRVWISQPTWPNHQAIFQAAHVEVCHYPYYDSQQHQLDFNAMTEHLKQAQAGDVVIFHGCCHNPTGIDPTLEQWQILADMSCEAGWLPLFDFAYQGLGNGLEEDAQGLRVFAQTHDELLVASSFSKSFGMYCERVGALTLLAKDSEIANRSFSQVKSVIRANYSNPPSHGGLVVSTILADPTLCALWQQELTDMRNRIQRMRQLFVSTLADKGAQNDYSFICQQNGMFSFSGLNKQQVERLREEFAIYIVDSGRINVAGMTLDNMAMLCESIVEVE